MELVDCGSRKEEEKGSEKLNRQMGYRDCLDVATNQKQMMKWFEDMTYIQLQNGALVPELEAVKSALKQCYMSVDTTVTNASFNYNVKTQELEITIYRNGTVEKLPVKMLSDGEKGIISLVADIAYRMALLNPALLDRVLCAPGVVLVDEVDMHLHPLWQKKIVTDLISIFPNVQFVFTTHSPSVLVNVPKEHVLILDRHQLYEPQSTTYGRGVEEIMREIMQVDVRPEKVQKLIADFDEAIDVEDYEKARQYLTQMKEILGEEAREVIESQITLDVEMQE